MRRRHRRERFLFLAASRREYTKQGELNKAARDLFFGMDEHKWKASVRMTKDSFRRLLRELELPEAKIVMGKKGGAGGSNQFAPHIRLAASLFYWASGNNFHNVGTQFGQISARTIYNFVDEVGEAIRSKILYEYVKWPTQEQQGRDAGRWEKWCGISAVVGALDGCHIDIRPANWGNFNPAHFHNYKGNHSVILMAICDFDGRFIWASHGAPGRMGDAASFATTPFNQDLKAKYGMGDNDGEGTRHRLLHKGVILGDAAFALSMWLLPPFKNLLNHRAIYNGEERDKMEVFNYRHSSARMKIEQTFGLWKNRWKVMQDRRFARKLAALPTTIDVTLALHNFLMEVETEHYLGDPELIDEWARVFREKHAEDELLPNNDARFTKSQLYQLAVVKREKEMEYIYANPEVGNDDKRYKRTVFGPRR
jgi:hypothetical protein